MTHKENVLQLYEAIKEADRSVHWLQRSYGICASFDVDADLTDEQLDALEALTSRFVRTSDMLVQQVFRAIDKVELTEGGSLLDALNRAHKRGLIKSIDEIREIRDLRNDIAHEYLSDELTAFLGEVLKKTPILLEIINVTQKYVTQKHKI